MYPVDEVSMGVQNDQNIFDEARNLFSNKVNSVSQYQSLNRKDILKSNFDD